MALSLVLVKLGLAVTLVSAPAVWMVMSLGSSSQVPDLPCADWAVTMVPSATLTRAAEVSMKPPSPPLGAEASSLPPTLALPLCMSPISRMVPL